MKLLFSFIILFLFNSSLLTSQVNTSNSAKKETTKELFDKFFAISDGDKEEVPKKFTLGMQICELEPGSKYCQYIANWGCYLGKTENYAKLASTLESLIKSYPEFAELYFLYGQYLISESQEGGLEQIQKCIELNPKLFQPYFYLATIYNQAKNYKLALTYYNLLEQTSPKHKSLYYNRAAVKSELKDFDGAVLDYTKAMELYPEETRALFNRGWVHINAKAYDKAEVDFSSYIKLFPDYGLAYYYRGAAKYYLTRQSEACEDMKTASKLGYADATTFVEKYCN